MEKKEEEKRRDKEKEWGKEEKIKVSGGAQGRRGWRGAAAVADAGAQHGQAEPSELQWRSGSPTFLWNTVFTLRSSEGVGAGGCEGDDAQGRKSSPFTEGVCERVWESLVL